MSGSEGLGRRLRHGALWSYAQTAGMTLLQFAGGVVLARLLEPRDFGLFMAATAYTAILGIQVRFGLSEAIVQRADLDKSILHGAFWMMVGVGLVGVLLVVAGAPLLSRVYGDPAVGSIALLMSVNFLLIPYESVASAILVRRMDFRSTTAVKVTSALVGLAASIACALAGLGVYSLVVGGIAASVASLVVLFVRLRWWPRAPRLSGVRVLLRYAWSVNKINLLEVGSERMDNALLGVLSGAYWLGIYGRAYGLARMPVDNFALSLKPVLLSGLSHIQGDLGESARVYLKALSLVALAVFPIICCLVAVAPEFIGLVYGEKWLPAATPCRVMALGALATTVTITLQGLSGAQNMVAREVRIQLSRLLLTGVAVGALASHGITWVAFGIAGREVVVAVLMGRLVVTSSLPVRSRDFLHALAPALGASLLATGGVAVVSRSLASTELSSLSLLGAKAATLFLSYMAVITVIRWLWPDNDATAYFLQWFRRILPSLCFLPRAV